MAPVVRHDALLNFDARPVCALHIINTETNYAIAYAAGPIAFSKRSPNHLSVERPVDAWLI